MREAIFRGLAGLVALLFGVALLVTPRGQMNAEGLFMFGGLTLMFGLYALFGPRPAYWIMWALFGVESKYEQKTGKGKKHGE